MKQTDISTKMILDRWNSLLKTGDGLVDTLSDENLQKEIAVGKNRGIYVLGHLIAVHDAMLPLLDLGKIQYPELEIPFLKSADKVIADLPSAAQLKSLWKKQSAHLSATFNAMNSDAWFEKHTAVSAEDFAKEPHRNKLNILLTRSTHLAYHQGQLVLLKQTL
jgi:hypothetical protein